ncbi:MAG: MarR family transcriptional regulator [Streptosporangiaceae bacterium]|nr:MarR family transcriptional regulator [Streptosporangiaceae bacterium]MBV9854350.1 MarR family transcriptional regulator [Streptosporangiaceae bacterium]
MERDAVVTAWRQVAACHAAACAALEHELGERHGLGVSDFEVLERLAESPERKARSQDLAEAVHLSQSALSRLVDRLARHGLVERCACDMDRRGVYVVLTEAGQHRHAEAVPTHREVLSRVLTPQVPGQVVAAAVSPIPSLLQVRGCAGMAHSLSLPAPVRES